jgi:hypothetical protein
MKLYVVSTKYQPLVSYNENPGYFKKPVSKINVSNIDLIDTFIASEADSLIACTKKESA